MEFVYILIEGDRYEDSTWNRAAFKTEEELFDAYLSWTPSDNLYFGVDVIPFGDRYDDEGYAFYADFHRRFMDIVIKKYAHVV